MTGEAGLWGQVLAGDDSGWLAHPITQGEDISDLTDEQVIECLAFTPPKWLREGETLEPSDEVVSQLGKAYVGKRYPVPTRKGKGTWRANKRGLVRDDFEKHLAGDVLLGAYIMDDNDRTGVAVIDIDADGALREAMAEGGYMAKLDMACYTQMMARHMVVTFGGPVHATMTGGKGAHVIYVPPERCAAAIVRRQIQWMCVRLGFKRDQLQWGHESGDFFVECFPKQDNVGNGLGNLIRLPHGVDPFTGRNSLVISDSTDPVRALPFEPMYGNEPIGASDTSRREIQSLVAGSVSDRGNSGCDLSWIHSVFDSVEVEDSFVGRCESLIDSSFGWNSGDRLQMLNAVGQAIHMAGWFNQVYAKGLLSDLEIVAEGVS